MTAWIVLLALVALFTLAARHGRPADPPVVEQAGRAENEHPGAHGEQRRAGRGGVAQRLEHLFGELPEPGGGNRDEVRTLQRVKPEGGDDLDAAGGGDRLPGTRAAHPEVEERDSVVRAIHPEDLAQHPELEHGQLVEDEDGDATEHAGSVLAEF